MRKLLGLAAALALLVAAVPAFAATRTVSVDDNVFAPKTLTVNKGTTLRFRWVGDAPHNVKGAGFSSTTKSSGTYSRRATRSGTIVCTIHPGMELKLRVRR